MSFSESYRESNHAVALREKAMLWGAFAVVLFAIRWSLYGLLLSPSIAILFGLEDIGVFDAPSDNYVDLADPGLLILALVSLLACFCYLASWYRERDTRKSLPD